MRVLMIAAALAFTAAAPLANAQAESKTPPASKSPPPVQCQGPDGKDAINAKCKGAGAAPALYKFDDKGVCRDSDGKAVKKANCKPSS